MKITSFWVAIPLAILAIISALSSFYQSKRGIQATNKSKTQDSLIKHIEGNKLPKRSNTGQPLEYYIDKLGTPNVFAYAQVEGKRIDLSSELQQRSNGEDRPFKPNENLSDPITGKKWNWVGSDRSGGPDRPIKPSGLGDINVDCVNNFDCAAKNHDIQYWLQTHFETGASVFLRIKDSWSRYEVKTEESVNNQVIEEFIKAAELVLKKAMDKAVAVKDQQAINKVSELQNKLQDHSLIGLINRTSVIHQVLTDSFFEPYM